MNPDHERILDKIVELKRKAGIDCLYNWRSWGLNEYHKRSEGLVLVVDYDVPGNLYTPEGMYVFGSIAWSGDAMTKFWALMKENFKLTELRPKRDDAKISEWEFQTLPSGPELLLEEL